MRKSRKELLFGVFLLAGCGQLALPGLGPVASPSARLSPTPLPTPDPPYFIDKLRQTAFPGGPIAIGERTLRGAGYTKFSMTWPSQGQTMTGTIALPDGPGPFPVVIVNHGYIPPDTYWVGQDSGIYGDPLAAHGFIAIAPNYPGYAGSGPEDTVYPPVIYNAMADLDLMSSLKSLPQADGSRIGMIGHSLGGGVSLYVSVIDTRLRALALFAPISSDMTDNAREWVAIAPSGTVPAPESNPEAYRRISPRNYFSPASPPTLLLQGTADEDIPREWSEATIRGLQQKSVETAVAWYPGARHNLVGRDLADAVARAEAWIRRHLG